jgi:hypothetical protein
MKHVDGQAWTAYPLSINSMHFVQIIRKEEESELHIFNTIEKDKILQNLNQQRLWHIL